MRPSTCADHFPLVGAEENEIAFLNAQAAGQRVLLSVRKELHDGRLPFSVLDLDESQASSAVLTRNLRKMLDLARGNIRESLGVDGLHNSAGFDGRAKHLELALAKNVVKGDKFHTESAVRLVNAVTIHGFLIGQARKGTRDVGAPHELENLRKQALDKRKNLLLGHEGDLHVDLRQFGDPIGTGIFIAETFCDLEIPLDSAHHQQLLVLLRGLRKRVKAPRKDSARHEEFARSLRSALREQRRFDFEKPLRVEVVTSCLGDLMAHREIAHHLRAPQVQITVLET